MITEAEYAEAETRRWCERYEQHLDQLPELIHHLRDTLNPLKAGGLDERVSGGGGAAPAPMRLEPVDDCDDLWSALIEYVGEVAERLQNPAPRAAGAAWNASGSIRGIPARMGAKEAHHATYELIAWLIDRERQVRDLNLTDSEQHLFALIRKLMTRYVLPPKERAEHSRECGICGEFAVRTEWVLGDAGEARCRVCGATYTHMNEGTEAT